MDHYEILEQLDKDISGKPVSGEYRMDTLDYIVREYLLRRVGADTAKQIILSGTTGQTGVWGGGQ